LSNRSNEDQKKYSLFKKNLAGALSMERMFGALLALIASLIVCVEIILLF